LASSGSLSFRPHPDQPERRRSQALDPKIVNTVDLCHSDRRPTDAGGRTKPEEST
jgi:hypothetical protein